MEQCRCAVTVFWTFDASEGADETLAGDTKQLARCNGTKLIEVLQELEIVANRLAKADTNIDVDLTDAGVMG